MVCSSGCSMMYMYQSSIFRRTGGRMASRVNQLTGLPGRGLNTSYSDCVCQHTSHVWRTMSARPDLDDAGDDNDEHSSCTSHNSKAGPSPILRAIEPLGTTTCFTTVALGHPRHASPRAANNDDHAVVHCRPIKWRRGPIREDR